MMCVRCVRDVCVCVCRHASILCLTDEQAVRFGLLADTARAWVAVHSLVDQAPDEAINRVVYALTYDLEFQSAWRAINGTTAHSQAQPHSDSHAPPIRW